MNKNIFIIIVILVLSLVVSGIAGCPKEETTENKIVGNEIAGNQILLTSFKFIYETWVPGNSGHIFSKIIVFNLEGKDIALINREGLRGRNLIQGIPGEEISDGASINYGNGEYGIDLGTIINSECSLEYGDGKFCEFFMTGKCLLSCKSDQTIEIINMDKLNECLSSEGNDVISNILKEGITIHDLDLDSPCSFYNGEYLKLVE